jgi:hypothetical protein
MASRTEPKITYNFMKDSPHQPDAKLTEDWGYDKHGVDTKYSKADPVGSLNHVPTRHPKESGGAHTRKYYITAATEPAELKALRERSGIKTPNPIDHILPPPKSGFDPERIIPQPKTGKGKPGDWHGNITRDGTHTTS